jgi:hypothetical protein
MKAFWEWIQTCWRGVLVIMGILSMFVAIGVGYSSIVTTTALEKTKIQLKERMDMKDAQLKQETNLAMEAIVKQMEVKSDLDRLTQINDTITKLRIQQREFKDSPKILKAIEADLAAASADKIKIEEKLKKR